MDWRHRLLWIDGSGGLLVGVLVLLASGWLSDLHDLPRSFLLFMGVANLAYGTYSLTLASRPRRPLVLIGLLIGANLAWALLCVRWAFLYHEVASPFGTLHLIGEGAYVGGLAILEWRCRDLLRTAPSAT